MSRLREEIDERVRTFLERPIEGLPGRVGERRPNPAPSGQWPYLWIDATYVKMREAGRIVSVAVTIAVAVNTDGRREAAGKSGPTLVVGPFPDSGMAIGVSPCGAVGSPHPTSEAETFWVEFLRRLKRRGLALWHTDLLNRVPSTRLHQGFGQPIGVRRRMVQPSPACCFQRGPTTAAKPGQV